MKKKIFLILAIFVFGTIQSFSYETIRIAVASLKNFGDTKAGKDAHLLFIAERIAEQAVKGIVVVDEIQDVDGSAPELLKQKVIDIAHIPIEMKLSVRVGGGRKEQFGFFYNPGLLNIVGTVDTLDFQGIERDPAIATFKANAGFDFILCAFHTRPSGQPLKDELELLDEVFQRALNRDSHEKDIIFVGDFNAPPERNNPTSQTFGIRDYMDIQPSQDMVFAIKNEPTNVKQTKIYDNIFFDVNNTDEYIYGCQHIVRIDKMIDEFSENISTEDKLDWFSNNVLDHCPIYAVFRADIDTDN